MKLLFLGTAVLVALGGCGERGTGPDKVQAEPQDKVVTTGKVPVALDMVPAAVLAAVKASEPDFVLAEASAEIRDGRSYYDVEGRMPDGSELEFDLLEEDGAWRVVERQRDIVFEVVPEPVRTSFAKVPDPYTPARVIESTQSDGVVIYELFAAAPDGIEPRKVEVKYDGRSAELLTREWAH